MIVASWSCRGHALPRDLSLPSDSCLTLNGNSKEQQTHNKWGYILVIHRIAHMPWVPFLRELDLLRYSHKLSTASPPACAKHLRLTTDEILDRGQVEVRFLVGGVLHREESSYVIPSCVLQSLLTARETVRFVVGYFLGPHTERLLLLVKTVPAGRRLGELGHAAQNVAPQF